jgi:hypothetical protein
MNAFTNPLLNELLFLEKESLKKEPKENLRK